MRRHRTVRPASPTGPLSAGPRSYCRGYQTSATQPRGHDALTAVHNRHWRRDMAGLAADARARCAGSQIGPTQHGSDYPVASSTRRVSGEPITAPGPSNLA